MRIQVHKIQTKIKIIGTGAFEMEIESNNIHRINEINLLQTVIFENYSSFARTDAQHDGKMELKNCEASAFYLCVCVSNSIQIN